VWANIAIYSNGELRYYTRLDRLPERRTFWGCWSWFFTDQIPFLLPSQWCQSTEGALLHMHNIFLILLVLRGSFIQPLPTLSGWEIGWHLMKDLMTEWAAAVLYMNWWDDAFLLQKQQLRQGSTAVGKENSVFLYADIEVRALTIRRVWWNLCANAKVEAAFCVSRQRKLRFSLCRRWSKGAVGCGETCV